MLNWITTNRLFLFRSLMHYVNHLQQIGLYIFQINVLIIKENVTFISENKLFRIRKYTIKYLTARIAASSNSKLPLLILTFEILIHSRRTFNPYPNPHFYVFFCVCEMFHGTDYIILDSSECDGTLEHMDFTFSSMSTTKPT